MHHGAVRIDLKEKDKKYPAQHRYFGKEHFKEVDGEVFWCVATKQGKRKRLINATTGIKHDQKKYIGTMKRTAVVDKLRELITQAYKNALGAKTCRHDKGKAKKKQITIPRSSDHPSATNRRHRWSQHECVVHTKGIVHRTRP